MALGELKNGIGPDAYAIYQQVLAAVVERDHPVGSLYISENVTSPAELYGGTWERIEGKFIIGASDTYPAGSTGGSATHTQTDAEMPSHFHGYGNQYSGDAHFAQWQFYIPDVVQITDAEGKNCAWAVTARSGNGKPMDILNPYYSTYIWRRVA
jgi:hypothetical protein